MHAEKDSSDQYYQGATAEIRLGIYKIDYRNSASETVWDTVFSSRAVQPYPLARQVPDRKQVSVFESREKIQANDLIKN